MDTINQMQQSVTGDDFRENQRTHDKDKISVVLMLSGKRVREKAAVWNLFYRTEIH